MKELTPARIRAAWIIALATDAIQIGLFPFSGLGWLIDIPLDLLTAVLLWGILGWHWALLPSFLFELLPIADMAPTWSLAIWVITARKKPQESI